MATTWMKALHRSGGGVAAALGLRIDYAKDYTKTDDGALIDSYECDPYTAQNEFLFSKRLYAKKTGRDQGKHDVIAYHVRMSFKPGEVTPQRTLELGRELALRWTKGRHQFIVAAHTNTNNPHAHIVFNSVNLYCDRKFADFKHSAIALRRVSDRVCLEHGLSVIEKPGLSKGYNRAEYLRQSKPPTVREQLRDIMDAALAGCKSHDDFLSALLAAGVDIKHGKQLAFKLPGAKKFVRQDTLGDDYSVDAIQERIDGKRIITHKRKTVAPVAASTKPNLLIDIQSKIQQGYGEGFRRWATVQNLKEAAKTLLFLQEHGITDYESLVEQAAEASKTFGAHNDRRKTIEVRLREIAELQKHIGV
ncbi:MAG TPA: relaxase, partial [Clostridiales bacterium]|nr:relaxase [Clostridiales bacterium]